MTVLEIDSNANGRANYRTTFSYDADGNMDLKEIDTTADGEVEYTFVYTYDENGNIATEDDLDGESLVPILENTEMKGKPYARSFYYRNRALGKTLKTDFYRIVRWSTESDSTVAIELYDHRNDPGENINIASENKALTDSLLFQLNGAKFLTADKPFQDGWE